MIKISYDTVAGWVEPDDVVKFALIAALMNPGQSELRPNILDEVAAVRDRVEDLKSIVGRGQVGDKVDHVLNSINDILERLCPKELMDTYVKVGGGDGEDGVDGSGGEAGSDESEGA